MRITFGRSGLWTTRVGGPQPAPSKQTATNASTVERMCRRGGLGGLVVARPMRGRLYPLTGSRSSRAPIWATGAFKAALKTSWSSGEETIDGSDDVCLSQTLPNTARTVANALGYGLTVRSARSR